MRFDGIVPAGMPPTHGQELQQLHPMLSAPLNRRTCLPSTPTPPPSADRSPRAHHHRAPRRRPARRPDRDQVRRHLPLRHPHRPRRVGRAAPTRWSPATRSPASSPRSAPTSPSTPSATASASAAWSTPAASARTAWPARSSTASKGNTGTYGAVDRDGTITQGGYSTHVVVDRGLRGHASPRASSSTSPRRCCAPASPPTRRCATGAPAPARRSPSSASAGSATWPSRSPTPWAPRSPSCRSR